MNKTLSTMVAAATLCLASQASAGTINFATEGASGETGIAGVTYSTTASFGTGGFDNGSTAGVVTATNNATIQGLGLDAQPTDTGFMRVVDSRVEGVSVVGAWEMLTITFSEAVNLTSFLLGRMDDNDDFEYSFDGGSFISHFSLYGDGDVVPVTLSQYEQEFVMAPANYITTFSIRAVGSFANDDDDFALKSLNVSAVPRTASGTLHPDEVKAIRERAGLSQVAFATLLGMSPATINRYEMGSPIAVKEDNLIRMTGIPSALRMLMQQRGHLLKPGQRPGR